MTCSHLVFGNSVLFSTLTSCHPKYNKDTLTLEAEVQRALAHQPVCWVLELEPSHVVVPHGREHVPNGKGLDRALESTALCRYGSGTTPQ